MDSRDIEHIVSGGLHGRIAATVPKLRRGRVWCLTCGHTQRVNAATCLRDGWPKHCGHTMTIDSPKER